MPVRTVDDANMPAEYYGLTLDADYPYFSSASGNSFSAAAAPDNAPEIDLGYFRSDATGANLVAPAALTDQGTFNQFAIAWGRVSTSFRLSSLSSEEFDASLDATIYESLYQQGVPIQIPNNPEGSRLNEKTRTLADGHVIVFCGTNGAYGLLRVNQIQPESLVLDIKVQPTDVNEAYNV
jgi:hypothetical protein